MNEQKQPAVAGPVEPTVRHRAAFEAWISAPPFEREVERFGENSAWPGNYRELDVDLAWCAWSAAMATARERCAKAVEIQQLRQLLAVRVAGALLYADDGELQDNTQHPCIDFRRDAPNEIQRKLQERGLANYRRSLDDEARGIGA